jgi:hypothetical protein
MNSYAQLIISHSPLDFSILAYARLLVKSRGSFSLEPSDSNLMRQHSPSALMQHPMISYLLNTSFF